MRRIFSLCAVTIICLATACFAGELPLREGDIVFQSFPSSQTKAIQLATNSRFSHVGMILRHNGKLMVYEAVGPVKFTSVDSWIGRDGDRHFLAKRLKNADKVLNRENLAKLRTAALAFEGRPYDFGFNWSDDKLYCSELVWKSFHRALGIDVGKVRKMKDFDLSSPEVKAIVAERYPKGVPLEEIVVSPEDVFESAALITVYKQ